MSNPALARSTDPVESHIAAAKVETTPLEDRVLFALGQRPMTTHQLAAYLDLSLVTVSPRLAPLRRKGKVQRSGRTDNGRAVWELVR